MNVRAAKTVRLSNWTQRFINIAIHIRKISKCTIRFLEKKLMNEINFSGGIDFRRRKQSTNFCFGQNRMLIRRISLNLILRQLKIIVEFRLILFFLSDILLTSLTTKRRIWTFSFVKLQIDSDRKFNDLIVDSDTLDRGRFLKRERHFPEQVIDRIFKLRQFKHKENKRHLRIAP